MLNSTVKGHGVVRFDYVKPTRTSVVAPTSATSSTDLTKHAISTGAAPKTAAEIEAEAKQLAADVAAASAAK